LPELCAETLLGRVWFSDKSNFFEACALRKIYRVTDASIRNFGPTTD